VVAPWKVALAYVLALVVAFVSDAVLPAWSGTLIAATFLYAPFLAARRQPDPALAWGLHLADWRRSLGVALAWCGLLFPLFALGFGGYQRFILQRGADDGRGWAWPVFERARLERWDDDLYGEPGPTAAGLVLRARPDDRLVLANRGDALAKVRIEGPLAERGVRVSSKGRLTRSDGGLEIELPRGGTATSRWPARGTLRVHEPPDAVLRGPSGAPLAPPGSPLDMAPGLGWWATFVLWQLAMIALSEELFFRGFVQASLNARWTARWRLLGAEVGWAWPTTAALFAVGHLATTPHPARLMVFFPGLLMGWLRERTGGLLAPVVFHGLANVLMELLVRLHAA
jgi:hypothetical protein